MKHDAPQVFAADPPAFEELQALLVFVATGGVAAAAEALDLPQPTLSRRLKVFQKRDTQDEPILVRSGRNLRLTDKGHAALPAIRELVRQYEQLDRFFTGTQDACETVRLGIGSFGAEHYLPRALAELRRGKVSCDVQSQVVRGQERVVGVAEGRFDAAIVTHDPRQVQMIVSGSSNPRTRLASEPLATHAFCVVARLRTAFGDELRAAPSNRPAPLELVSRGEYVGLDQQSGIRLQLEAEFQKMGLPLRFVAGTTAGGWPAAKEYVRHGLGAAIVPLAALAVGDDKLFAIRRLPERFAVTDYLLRRQAPADAPEPPLIPALRSAAQEHLKTVREVWQGLV